MAAALCVAHVRPPKLEERWWSTAFAFLLSAGACVVSRLEVEVEGVQSSNPRTGAVVPLTVLRAIKVRLASVVLGA